MKDEEEPTRPLARPADEATGESSRSGPPGIGETFDGRYLIIERLAAGSNGCVYRARDLELDREVALKLLQGSAWNGNSGTSRSEEVLAEARAIARLEHPNIVPVHAVGEARGIPYLVMSLIEGRSLSELLCEESALEPERALSIIRQVCRGLDYAHSRGLIHRDVKPSNIILEDGDRARLVDFGLACLKDEANGSDDRRDVVGTVGYMAPEVLQGAAPSPRSDLFAAAIVQYRMVTGRSAFEGETESDVMARVLGHTPPPPHAVRKGIPRGVGRVLDRAMAKLPEDRFPSGTAFVRALEKAHLLKKAWRLAAVAAVLISVLGAAGWWWRASRPLELRAEVWATTQTAAGEAISAPVKSDTVLQAGDRIWIEEVEANRPAYLHLILLDSDGRMQRIFPSEAIPVDQPLRGGRNYRIPPEEKWQVDERTGPETIYLAASRREVPPGELDSFLMGLATRVTEIARAGPHRQRGLTGPVPAPSLRQEQEDEVERLLRERFPVVHHFHFIHE